VNSPATLLLTNAQLVDPASGREGRGAILVRAGLIADVVWGAIPAAPEGAEIVDCGGLVLAPGLVDMRAFVGEPGAEHRETLKSASEAAAKGGVTTLVCMPDTNPAVDDPAIVDFLLRRARDTAIVNILPAAAITKGLAGREMTEIGLLRQAGAIAFTDGAHPLADAGVMRRVLVYARDHDALIMPHVQEPSLVGSGVMNAGELAGRLGLTGIPREAETIMLERDLRLVRLTGGRYHAAMISCADSAEIMARARQAGLNVTCGVSINNLTLNENDVIGYRTFCRLSPPLRHEEDRQAVIDALAAGLIDVIVSDHNPQDVETKRLPFSEAADGAVGLETLLSAALRLVHDGRIGLAPLLRSLSTRPAEILGLSAGRLAPGAPADLIVVDTEAPYVLDKTRLRSLSKNSPFDEARLEGRVRKTFVGGRLVYDAAEDDAAGQGAG
jgi:dihydroorotase